MPFLPGPVIYWTARHDGRSWRVTDEHGRLQCSLGASVSIAEWADLRRRIVDACGANLLVIPKDSP